jgi:hypothetical protein
VPDAPLSFSTRLWFSFACFFRVLLDGSFAARAFAARDALPPPPPKLETKELPPAKEPPPAAGPSDASARTLLALLQSSGRFVDFLEEDVASFSDADVGVAARVVHAGCRKALREHVTLAPVRTEEEGATLTIEKGYDAAALKLTGRVTGEGPWRGALRHRGWRIAKLSLPTLLEGASGEILAPAEVEL